MKRVLIVFVFSFLLMFSAVSAFSQDRQSLLDEINGIKTEYYQEKYVIDNQIRELSREWHMYQMQMHEEIKADPERAKAVRAELWEGAKQLSEKKKALYNQLTPLRKAWYKRRMVIEAKIAEIDAQIEAQWD